MSFLGILALITVASLNKELPHSLYENDTTVYYPVVHQISLSLGFDYVSSSVTDEIRDKSKLNDITTVHTSLPLQFKYAFSFTDPHVRNYLPGGYQGIGVGLQNYGALERKGLLKSTKYIGYPVNVYVYQGGPFWHIHKNLSLNYEWNFGASFGWKPYSEKNEDFNLTVGSRVNAYLNLNVFLSWKLNKYTSIFGGLAVNHFSNGNTSWPNPGVNSFGLRVGLIRTFNPLGKDFEPVLPDTIKKRKLEYDIIGWGSARKRVYRGGETPVLLPGHFACAGISFAPMVRLGRWWRVGGSADFQWDQSSDLKDNYVEGTTTDDIKFYRPSFWKQVNIGISAHGELQMPIFALNIGLGYNLLSPAENKRFYQNISLKTYLGNKLFLNVGYQLRNFHQQSSLMLGLGITI